MAANFSPEIMAKIKEVTAMTYADQAIFYLNAFVCFSLDHIDLVHIVAPTMPLSFPSTILQCRIDTGLYPAFH